MHPYRTPPDSDAADAADPGPPAEEVAIGAALGGLGGLRVAAAVASGEVFGAEATLAAIACALGTLVLLRFAVRRHRARRAVRTGAAR